MPRFFNRHFNHDIELANAVANKIDRILMTLNKNKSALAESHNDFAFIASSLLVAYDEKDPANMDVRIIDFDQSWKIDTRNSSSEDQQSIDKFNQMFNKGLHDFKKLIMNVSTAN